MSECAGSHRAPATTWEYAVSAAGQLMLWHTGTTADVLREPLRTRTVVLVATAVAGTARIRGTAGPAETGTPRWRACSCTHATALEGCGAPAGAGAEEVGLLMAAYGAPEFEAVRTAALEMLEHHLQDADGTLGSDRRPGRGPAPGRAQAAAGGPGRRRRGRHLIRTEGLGMAVDVMSDRLGELYPAGVRARVRCAGRAGSVVVPVGFVPPHLPRPLPPPRTGQRTVPGP